MNHSISVSYQEDADEVIRILSKSEPSILVSVCASPCMVNLDPAATLQTLRRLEDTMGVSVPLTISMAAMALRLGAVAQYTELMERHAEVKMMQSLTNANGSIFFHSSYYILGKTPNYSCNMNTIYKWMCCMFCVTVFCSVCIKRCGLHSDAAGVWVY